jgi:hypothetical protein
MYGSVEVRMKILTHCLNCFFAMRYPDIKTPDSTYDGCEETQKVHFLYSMDSTRSRLVPIHFVLN